MRAEVPELVSLVLSLSYQGEVDPGRQIPRWWGKSAHALMLKLIQKSSPKKAQAIHDANSGPPPFTTSTLIGYRVREGLSGEAIYRLRLTSLTREISEILFRSLEAGGALAAGNQLDLDYLPFRIEKADWTGETHPWAGNSTYQQLGANWLSAENDPSRRLGFMFTSPTFFKSAGKYQPFPLPELVFQSLMLQWNSYGSITFPAEVKRFASECLAVRRFEISSRKVTLGKKIHRTGTVGKVTYLATHYDRYWLSVLHTLAAFARFAGIEKSTALGLGQARKDG